MYKEFIDTIENNINTWMEEINMDYDLLSNEEKKRLIRIASCFDNCITTNAILEDYDDKENKPL